MQRLTELVYTALSGGEEDACIELNSVVRPNGKSKRVRGTNICLDELLGISRGVVSGETVKYSVLEALINGYKKLNASDVYIDTYVDISDSGVILANRGERLRMLGVWEEVGLKPYSPYILVSLKRGKGERLWFTLGLAYPENVVDALLASPPSLSVVVWKRGKKPQASLVFDFDEMMPALERSIVVPLAETRLGHHDLKRLVELLTSLPGPEYLGLTLVEAVSGVTEHQKSKVWKTGGSYVTTVPRKLESCREIRRYSLGPALLLECVGN